MESTRFSYPTAVVLAALIGGLASISVAWIASMKTPLAPPRDPPKETLPTQSPAQQGKQNFGSWTEDLKPNVAYRATSDGFVSVFSAGSSPSPGADVMTGAEPEKLATRSRFNAKWGGIVAPVAKGEYWLVQPLPGGGTLQVHWMPVQASQK